MPHGTPGFPVGLSMRLGACQMMPMHGAPVQAPPVGQNPGRRDEDRLTVKVRRGVSTSVKEQKPSYNEKGLGSTQDKMNGLQCTGPQHENKWVLAPCGKYISRAAHPLQAQAAGECLLLDLAPTKWMRSERDHLQRGSQIRGRGCHHTGVSAVLYGAGDLGPRT